MGIMVYSLLWVMQDFVHQQYCLGFRAYGVTRGPKQSESGLEADHTFIQEGP